jgi:hypothetical protein
MKYYILIKSLLIGIERMSFNLSFVGRNEEVRYQHY